MSSSESELSAHSSETSDTNEEIYCSQFRPYEGEPLAYHGEDLVGEVQLEDEEKDLDGLTPSMLEARFDKKVKVDSWCKCGESREERLVGSLEYRCCHEVGEALGKLVFDASIERISCITLHEDFEALTNETVLRQVGPMLRDKQGRSYRCRSGTPVKEYIRVVGYRWIARWLFGYMGPDNTRPLSACIYHKIREKYNTGHGGGYASAQERND